VSPADPAGADRAAEPADTSLADDLAAYVASDAAREAAAGTNARELDRALVPLLWLLGSWRGDGVASGALASGALAGGGADLAVTLEVSFSHDGGPHLRYGGRVLVGERVLATETGFWRVTPTGVEVVLAHPTGIVEVYVGTRESSRVELATDVVARSATAPADTAARRLYGLVEGRLLFAVDVATDGQPLASRMSGALDKV